MMQKRAVNLFLVSVCLIGILGIGTSALLAAHLSCSAKTPCGGDHSHHDEPEKPVHDHQNCAFCKLFSGANGKYLAGQGDLCPLGDTAAVSPVSFTSQPPLRHVLSGAVPRGPPAM